MKKGGRGAHNWGDTETETNVQEEVPEEKSPSGGETLSDNTAESPTRTGELEKGKEANETEETAKQPEIIMGVDEYRRQLEAKRANLPPKLESGPLRTITAQDMEKEGYSMYVKASDEVPVEEESEKEGDEDEEAERPKKKGLKMNIFEYAKRSGAGVPGYRGRRGGRGAGAGGRGGGYRGDFGGREGGGRDGGGRDGGGRDRFEGREREEFSKPPKVTKSLQITLNDQAEFPSLDARK